MGIDSGKARAIFTTAVEDYPPDRWGEFLDEACGDDELRRRVELLLKAHQGEDSFLDRGEEDNPASSHPNSDEPIGTMIGRYKVLEEIGEGGFEWYYRQQLLQTRNFKLSGHEGAIYFVCSSPDDRFIATAGEDATIRVYDALTREL